MRISKLRKDLEAEEKKLKGMLKLIEREKKLRHLAPIIKVLKHVQKLIERMDHLEEDSGEDFSPKPNLRTLLVPHAHEPPQLPIYCGHRNFSNFGYSQL